MKNKLTTKTVIYSVTVHARGLVILDTNGGLRRGYCGEDIGTLGIATHWDDPRINCAKCLAIKEDGRKNPTSEEGMD